MASWNYIQPVEIRFGAGLVNKIDEFAKELGVENGLLVADKFFMSNGLAQKIVDSMSYAEVLRMIAILEAARETQLAEKS